MIQRRFKLILLLAILAITLGISQIHAADHFVDNRPESGGANNPENGSEENPWISVNYGLSRIGSGDTLYVKSGTYDETLYIDSRKSGSEGLPTAIKAFPGSKPIIRGAGINTGRVKLTGVEYFVLEGLGVTNVNQGIYIESSRHVQIMNCEVFDVGQEAIHVNGSSEFVTIENCSVHDTGLWTANGEGIYIGTGSAGPVDNTNNIIIRNNVVFNTSTDRFGGEAIELKPGTHDCVVEGNLIYDSRSVGSAGAIEINESHLGVQSWNADPNHIIRNNILHGVRIAIRAGTGCTVYNNLIYNIDSDGFGILINNNAKDSHTRKIYHNTIIASTESAHKYISGSMDLQNNIGPIGGSNLLADDTYFAAPNADSPNFSLVENSLPIDSGVNLSIEVETDILGNPRTIGDKADIGAYEFQPAAISDPTHLRVD